MLAWQSAQGAQILQFYIGSSVKVCASSAEFTTDVLQKVISGCLSSNLHSMLQNEKV